MQRATAGVNTWRNLGSSAVAASITGTLTETALATITIPAGAMGPNGVIRVQLLWTVTNNANAKTLRIRLGGIGGTAHMTISGASTVSVTAHRVIANRNSQSSQVSSSAATTAFGNGAAAVVTGAIDTSASQTLVITAELGNIADTVTLESYLVELLNGA